MLERYQSDLHIHTCLSPCADLTMSPKRIVNMALNKRLRIIGICDHNSAENVQATVNAAYNKSLTVLPGMEVTSVEEVHLIALFDEIDKVLNLQNIVYKHLIRGKNKKELFGEQIIANEFDEIEGYNTRLLIGATTLSLSEIVKYIHKNDGLVIAAHVDRMSYIIIGQLGFIPDDLNLDALEISKSRIIAQVHKNIPESKEFPLIFSSDAHELKDIGNSTTTFLLAHPNIEELHLALQQKRGRKIFPEA
jgi:predicted metal-dependent phosphoesterase TrpH